MKIPFKRDCNYQNKIMQKKKINLIYCEANKAEVQTTITRLSKANYTFIEINDVKFEKETLFTEALFNINSPGLLFLSDNFLKCSICMNGTTSLLQELIEKNQVLPIILDGRYPSDNGSDHKLVATQIEKVGHILKYMNHWQDRYLSLRKQKRTNDLNEKEKIELQAVKSVSNQVVDFLRCVKENTHLTYPAFKNNHFETFFQQFGDKQSYEQFKLVDQVPNVDTIAQKERVNLPTKAIFAGDTIEPIASTQFNKLTPVELLSFTNPIMETKGDTLEEVASSTVKAFLGDSFIQEQIVEKKEDIVPIQRTIVEGNISVATNNKLENRISAPLNPVSSNIPAVKQEGRKESLSINKSDTTTSKIKSIAAPNVVAIPVSEIIAPKEVTSKTDTIEQTNIKIPIVQPKLPSLSVAAEEQVMMIMGATSPIGTAIAKFFADKGYRIILTGNRFSLLYKMKVSLEDHFKKGVQLLPFDPYNKYSVEMAMEDLEKDWKNINIVLNISDFGDTPIRHDKQCNYNQMLHTNIEVISNLTQKIVPYLKEQKNGHIINIVPIDVSTSKGQICKVLTEGVGAYTKTLQLDLSNHNIKVSQLLPEFKGNLTEEMGTGIASLVHYMTTQPDNLLIKNVTLSNS